VGTSLAAGGAEISGLSPGVVLGLLAAGVSALGMDVAPTAA
jgi:hypothetical protein